jgi:predicted RNase H-like nuclease (RuvC/YqgF family)
VTSPNSDEIAAFYAIRNSDGQYFRAKGYGGGGATWVDTIEKAKVYQRIGPARARVTYFANNFPNYPTPELVKFIATRVEVLDETERVEKAKEKKKRETEQREVRQKKWQLKRAQQELEEAQARYDRLHGG